jgi:NADPH-dependent curcumin reductase CurA
LRGRMRPGKSYIPPFTVGEPVVSGIVARVIASKDDNYKVGDRVISKSLTLSPPVSTATRATP